MTFLVLGLNVIWLVVGLQCAAPGVVLFFNEQNII
jgi:hypothetical protein